MTNEQAHAYARDKGVSRPLYAAVKALLVPFLRVYFRMHVSGAPHIPAEGAAIIAPNHKSFYDSFFVALATKRHLRFMGKSELFKSWQGPLLVRLGAFPVRRGESDQEALQTARTILDQGGLLALFPEGTRVTDPDELGEPKRGAGRLALESGAPMVPTAITGTDHLWLGPIPKPKRVQVAFAEPVHVDAVEGGPEAAGELIEGQVWPEVQTHFQRLRSRPTIIAAGLAALGIGTGLAVQQRRGGGSKGLKRKLPGKSKPKVRVPVPGRSKPRRRISLPGRKRKSRNPFRR